MARDFAYQYEHKEFNPITRASSLAKVIYKDILRLDQNIK